jgi:hypothetical protein
MPEFLHESTPVALSKMPKFLHMSAGERGATAVVGGHFQVALRAKLKYTVPAEGLWGKPASCLTT